MSRTVRALVALIPSPLVPNALVPAIESGLSLTSGKAATFSAGRGEIVFNNRREGEVHALCIRIWRSRWTPVAGAAGLGQHRSDRTGIGAGSASIRTATPPISRASGITGSGSRHGPRARRPPFRGPRTRPASATRRSATSCSAASAETWSGSASRTPSGISARDGGASIAVAGTGAASEDRSVPLTFGGQPGSRSRSARRRKRPGPPARAGAAGPGGAACTCRRRPGRPRCTRWASRPSTWPPETTRGTPAPPPTPGAAVVVLHRRGRRAPPAEVRGTLVAFGDSITEASTRRSTPMRGGRTTSPGGSIRVVTRWPSPMRGSAATGPDLRLCCGVNALARFDRDVWSARVLRRSS